MTLAPQPAASMTAPAVAQPGTLNQRLRALVAGRVKAWDGRRSRSRQKTLGASALGHPCTRHLAYYATGAPEIGRPGDILPAIIGTWGHAGLDQVFGNDPDMELGQNVEIGPELRGTYDSYYLPENVVIDWKFLGKESLDRLRRHGPSQQYRVQVHAYAFGLMRQGRDVQHVALVCFPRSGYFRDLVVWTEPFDMDVVEQAFQRWYPLKEAAPILAGFPEMFRTLQMADGPCSFCPWLDPELSTTHPELACPGYGKEQQ